MKFIKNFTELSKNDAGIAGGKGASLGEMTQAGIPVPPGFVVLSESFEQFIRETDLIQEIDSILHKVEHKEIHTVEKASEQIRELILNAKMPKDIADEVSKSFKELDTKYVAVRSSATAEDGKDHAWAGQLESYLNTTEDDVLTKVKLCWSSLFTPRAIFYRFEKGLHSKKISVAVVVQKMVESEVSGIAFSVHPVTEDYNQLIIEAGFGLGEAIVFGSVTPDSYVVEKDPRNILDINVSTQTRALHRAEKASVEHGNNEWVSIPEPKASSQVLDKEQILELSEIILKIEKHYGFPCDIEWAFEAGKFYIVQSRPITTLRNKKTNSDNYNQPNPNEYARMFAGKSFPYLFSNVFLEYYKSLGVVSIQGQGSWMSFFPKSNIEKTKSEGSELYTNTDKYTEYKAGFDDYVKKSSQYFESTLEKPVPSKDDILEFFKHVSSLFIYYSKTEFFYTDGVDQSKMVISVKEFDDLKLGGRTYLNMVFFESDGYIKSLIKKVSSQTGVEESDLLNYNVNEISDLVGEGRIIDIKEVRDRDTFFESKNLVLFGSNAEDNINNFLSNYLEISNVIKGTIANKGKVKGLARVLVPDAKDFEKISIAVQEMKDGEILIAETTSPDIIMACKKAAAIVTNQGGQLSHAAIVSRELGIPCIIGTDKDVILNIKTGDMVEVDADNGVVRIL